MLSPLTCRAGERATTGTRRDRRRFAGIRVSFLVALTVALAALADPGVVAWHDSRTPDATNAPSAAARDGLNASDWSSIRAAYERHRHAVVAVPAAANTWRARTPSQQWTTRFDGRGFLVTPDSGGWTWGLELARYGSVDSPLRSAGAPTVSIDDSRVTYTRDADVDEWFVNASRGIEHGFTLRARPAAAAGALVFEFAVHGGLTPSVHGDGRGITFVDGQGTAAVTYAGLTVFDADGRTLPARFEPAPALRLVVDDRGARYPITIDPTAQQAYLKPSNTGVGDNFGWSVAVSGDTVVVGTRNEDSNATGIDGNGADNSATESGAAYVFVRSNGQWTQQAYLKASNTGDGDQFGFSVAVAGDTVAIGAPFEDSSATGVNGDGSNNSATESGAAYVFVRSGATWSQQAYLKASNTGGGDQFGFSVAVSGDLVIVGAPNEASNATGVNGNQADNSAELAGAAYVFVRSSAVWTQQAYLKASNAEEFDQFGWDVAASVGTVLVGAPYEDSSSIGVNNDQTNDEVTDSGAAYAFASSNGVWSQQAYLKASNTGPSIVTGEPDSFGYSVAISADTIVVGAPYEDSNATGVNGSGSNENAVDSGAAYVFVRTSGSWGEQAFLKASNTGAADSFGWGVAVSGNTAVVGAAFEDSNATGVDGDGANDSAPGAGAAYVFVRSGVAWSHLAYLKASNTGAQDAFGVSVAIQGGTIAIGAIFEDSNATGVNGDGADNSTGEAGAAYVFSTPNEAPTISDIPNATTPRNTPLVVDFTVDDDSGATSVSVSGASSNVVLVPNANLAFGGSGTNRTLTITPALNQQGITMVTVTVSDGALSATRTFTLTVGTFTPFGEALVAGSTVIKAAHILELRNRIDAVRKAQGLGVFAWSSPAPAVGGTIRAFHIEELRTAVGQVYAAKGQSAPAYTDPVIVAQVTPVRATHIEELRSAVLGLE